MTWADRAMLSTYLTLVDRQHFALLTAITMVSVNWQLEQARLQARFDA